MRKTDDCLPVAWHHLYGDERDGCHMQLMPGTDNKTIKVLSHKCESSPVVVFVFRQGTSYHFPQFSVLCHKYVFHVCQPWALVMMEQSIAVIEATQCLVW